MTVFDDGIAHVVWGRETDAIDARYICFACAPSEWYIVGDDGDIFVHVLRQQHITCLSCVHATFHDRTVRREIVTLKKTPIRFVLLTATCL